MAHNLKEVVQNELTVCPVCLETFSDPRQLECRHSFCYKCLQTIHACAQDTGFVLCPMCRVRTNLPHTGLTDLKPDFVTRRLVELIQDTNNLSINSTTKSQNTDVQCSNCGHVSSSRASKSDKSEKRKHSQQTKVKPSNSNKASSFCPKHSDELLKYYCESCSVLACTLCVIQKHKSHFVIQK